MEHPRIKMTRDQVTLVTYLLDDSDDEQLKLDTLEGETDLFEVVGSLIAAIELAEGHIGIMNEQIKQRADRADRYQRKIEQLKALIMSLMETAGVRKLPMAEATVFTSERKGSWKITDPDLLPKKFL